MSDQQKKQKYQILLHTKALTGSNPRKEICPGCGQKKLVRYIKFWPETKDFQAIGGDYGKCDRINSCGYDIKPGLEDKVQLKQKRKVTQAAIIRPAAEEMAAFSRMDSNFHTFAADLGIDQKHLEAWKVGTASNGRTCFGIFSRDGQHLNTKFIPYEATGCRLRGDKDFPYHLKSKGEGSYEKGFYGAHLFDEGKDTAIVESEKTAILGAFFYPGVNWLAIGGNHGVKAEHINALFIGLASKIYFIGDNDKAGLESSALKTLIALTNKSQNLTLISSNPFAGQADGYDLADWILDNKEAISGDLEKDLYPSAKYYTNAQLAEIFPFWESFESDRGEIVYFIDPIKFWEWLQSELGYGLFFRDNHEMVFVRSKDGVISLTDEKQIKNAVYAYFKEFPSILRKITHPKKQLLSLSVLNFLDDLSNEIKTVRGTKDSDFLFFSNGFVKVTKDGPGQIQPYSKTKFKIWDGDVLPRTYREADYKKSDFYEFCQMITQKDPARLKSLMSGLGYMMHTYKDPSRAWAIVLVDQGTKEGEANGGTGKTLLTTALSHMRKMSREDGKNFGRRNANFMYQNVNEDTKIFCLDDVYQRFDYNLLFSVITGDWTVEKKGKDSYTIPFRESAKMMLTTNYMVKSIDQSTLRRFKEFEIYRRFNKDFTPIDHFKQLFFEDWNDDAWHAFDAFMIECLRIYLNDGLLEAATNDSARSKLASISSEEFADFIINKLKPKPGNKFYLFDLVEMYEEEYPEAPITEKRSYDFEGARMIKSRTIKGWIEAWAKINKVKYQAGRDRKWPKMAGSRNKYTYFEILD